MVIYADILIVLNLFVNYFIILATVKFLRKKIKLWRIIFGSFIGALSSLYIFLPQGSLIRDTAFKILICALMSSVIFKIKPIKQFIKFSGVLFFVTCTYSGMMIAIWRFFKPYGMAINNSIVYFSVSPIYIVLFSVIAYLTISLLIRIFSRTNVYAKDCEISVFLDDKKAEFKAIVDTGNSICDVFGKSDVIIVDKSIFDSIISTDKSKLQTRYRAIPYSSIQGNGVLEGYRCDKGTAVCEGKMVKLNTPIIAASHTSIKDDYYGIVNPQIFE